MVYTVRNAVHASSQSLVIPGTAGSASPVHTFQFSPGESLGSSSFVVVVVIAVVVVVVSDISVGIPVTAPDPSTGSSVSLLSSSSNTAMHSTALILLLLVGVQSVAVVAAAVVIIVVVVVASPAASSRRRLQGRVRAAMRHRHGSLPRLWRVRPLLLLLLAAQSEETRQPRPVDSLEPVSQRDVTDGVRWDARLLPPRRELYDRGSVALGESRCNAEQKTEPYEHATALDTGLACAGARLLLCLSVRSCLAAANVRSP